MGRTKAKQMRETKCPSCGASIPFLRDRNHVGTCPECGELLIQKRWSRRELEIVDDETKGDAFDESDEWVQRVMDEIK